MDIYDLLRLRYSEALIATHFLENYSSDEQHETAVRIFSQFILNVIGLQSKESSSVNPFNNNEFELNQYDLHNYNYNEMFINFNCCNDFITQFCVQSKENGQIVMLTEIVMSTLNICDRLLDNCNPYCAKFEMPLAHIALSFLKVINLIRVQKRIQLNLENLETSLLAVEVAILDSICTIFLEIAKKGIRHPDIKFLVIDNICTIFEYNFLVFILADNKSIHFFINYVFVEDTKSSGRIFNCLYKILKSSKHSKEEKNIIVNELIKQSFLLKLINFVIQGVVIFKVLNLIEIITKIFNKPYIATRELVDTIATNIFHSNKKIRKAAAQTYITILKTKMLTEKKILGEILDFHLSCQKDLTDLSNSIEVFWDSFQFIQKFENIFALFRKRNETIVNLIVCHFILMVCRKMIINKKYYKVELSNLIKFLPTTFKSLESDKDSIQILLQIFSIVNVNIFKLPYRENDKDIKDMSTYLADLFTKQYLNFTTCRNVFLYILDFCQVLRPDEDIVEAIAESVYDSFVDAAVRLENCFNNIDSEELKIVESDFMRFAVLLIYKPSIRVNEQFIDVLKSNLVDNNQFKIITRIYDGKLEGLAIRIYSRCLCSMIKNVIEDIVTEIESVERLVVLCNQFIEFLVENLIIKNRKASVFFAQMGIASVIELVLTLQEKNADSLSANISMLVATVHGQYFNIIIEAIKFYIFEYDNSSDPVIAQDNESRKEILENLTLLIKNHSNLPTVALWKIVFYYGLYKDYNDQLLEVLDALAKYESPTVKRGSIFCNIIPVVLHNLKKEKSDSEFEIILKQYDNFIESHFGKMNYIVKSHILLQSIERVVKDCSVRNADPNENRLALLSHLVMFINQYSLEFLQKLVTKIPTDELSSLEIDTLIKFKEQVMQILSTFQIECDDGR